MLAAAKAARSPAIYPALMLALHAGMRDAETRGLQWGRLDLAKAYLTVSERLIKEIGEVQPLFRQSSGRSTSGMKYSEGTVKSVWYKPLYSQ